jgi:protein ImuA
MLSVVTRRGRLAESERAADLAPWKRAAEATPCGPADDGVRREYASELAATEPATGRLPAVQRRTSDKAGGAAGCGPRGATPAEACGSSRTGLPGALRVPIKTMGDRPPACRATDQRSVPQSDLLGALSPRLAELAEQVRRLRTRSPRLLPRCSSGLPALDAALGGGFARGAIHEFLAPGGGAAARSVALLTATRAADRPRWIFYLDTTQDFYPPGAAQLGVPLERLLVLRAPHPLDALWACEQSLRCPGVAAVVLPLRSLDAYVSRRLQLAAESGGSLGLLIRSDTGGERTFAASRLQLDPLVGETHQRRMLVSILKLSEGGYREPFVLELPDGVGLAGGLAVPMRAAPEHASTPARPSVASGRAGVIGHSGATLDRATPA